MTLRPCSHWQFYPTRAPFANGTRRVARVHSASTVSGSSGTLRSRREVFSVDANGARRVGAVVSMRELTRPVRQRRAVCRMTHFFPLHTFLMLQISVAFHKCDIQEVEIGQMTAEKRFPDLHPCLLG